MNSLHPAIPTDRLLIPLAEVATLTGWSERSLLEDCRHEQIDHVNRKGTYSFTPEQVDALIKRYTRRATSEALTAAQREADELEAARRHNANRASRTASIRRAA